MLIKSLIVLALMLGGNLFIPNSNTSSYEEEKPIIDKCVRDCVFRLSPEDYSGGMQGLVNLCNDYCHKKCKPSRVHRLTKLKNNNNIDKNREIICQE